MSGSDTHRTHGGVHSSVAPLRTNPDALPPSEESGEPFLCDFERGNALPQHRTLLPERSILKNQSLRSSSARNTGVSTSKTRMTEAELAYMNPNNRPSLVKGFSQSSEPGQRRQEGGTPKANEDSKKKPLELLAQDKAWTEQRAFIVARVNAQEALEGCRPQDMGQTNHLLNPPAHITPRMTTQHPVVANESQHANYQRRRERPATAAQAQAKDTKRVDRLATTFDELLAGLGKKK